MKSFNYTVLKESENVAYFIYLFGFFYVAFNTVQVNITTGSWKGRGNQYIQLVKVLYWKLPTNGKQQPAFPLEVEPGFELRSQKCEMRVLPLSHRGSCMVLAKTRE